MRTFLLDAAICISFLFCFISWIKVGTAFGLIVVSCAIAFFLASEIVGQLRIVEDSGKVTPERWWEGSESERGSAEPGVRCGVVDMAGHREKRGGVSRLVMAPMVEPGGESGRSLSEPSSLSTGIQGWRSR